MHQALQGAPWRGCTLRLSGETRAPSRAQAPQRNHSAGSPPPGICVSRAVRCARAGWGGAASVSSSFSSHKAILEGRKSDDDDVASPFTLRAVGTLVRGMISFSDAAPKP